MTTETPSITERFPATVERLMTAGQVRIADVLTKATGTSCPWMIAVALGYQGTGAQNACRVRGQLKPMLNFGWLIEETSKHYRLSEAGRIMLARTKLAYTRRAMRRCSGE